MLIKSMSILVTIFFIPFTATAAFNEQVVTFKSDDSVILMGTFTKPSEQTKGKKIPAVLLLAGSGPTDRDGNQPPTLMVDLLKQIAHEFASQGIASVRFDKRAAHANKMQWPSDSKLLPKFFSWQNHQSDVRAAFNLMRSLKGIDSNRVAILGHSEGGILAMSQAKQLSAKALILIGTPGRTLGAIITEQISTLLDKQGASDSVKNEYLIKNAAIQKFISENGLIPRDVPAGLKALYPQSASLFLQDVLNLDPTTLAKKYSGPALIVNGELDTQASSIRDAKALYSAFQARKTASQKLIVIQSASHNLKKVNGSFEPGFVGPVDSNALAIV